MNRPQPTIAPHFFNDTKPTITCSVRAANSAGRTRNPVALFPLGTSVAFDMGTSAGSDRAHSTGFMGPPDTTGIFETPQTGTRGPSWFHVTITVRFLGCRRSVFVRGGAGRPSPRFSLPELMSRASFVLLFGTVPAVASRRGVPRRGLRDECVAVTKMNHGFHVLSSCVEGASIGRLRRYASVFDIRCDWLGIDNVVVVSEPRIP